MRIARPVLLLPVLAVTGPTVADAPPPGPVLYDNGGPDGIGGYSNATRGVFGARRTLLDDFVVPPGEAWIIGGLHWEHVWNSLPPGAGTGLEILFRADEAGRPGAVLTGPATVNGYDEIGTGVTYFARPAAESWARFDPVELPPGVYWIEATVVGPENNFWLIRGDVTGNESWVNYEDLGGLFRGTEQFGVPADLNFRLTGLIGCPGRAIATPETLAIVGTLLAGSVDDLAESDDVRVVIRNTPPASVRAPSIELEVTGTSPVEGPILLTFRAEAACSAWPAVVRQQIDLFNFMRGGWDEVDLRFATRDDSVAEIAVGGPADRYVEPGTRRLRVRVRWFDPGGLVNVGWNARIDQTVWDVTPDCNGNGEPDCADIAFGRSDDCNVNGIPDECEADCNGNGFPDDCDIAEGRSADCNDDGVPDDCEPDCNGNGFPDDCDIAEGRSADCNRNATPDECDIADGRSDDINRNGVPDECECIADVTGNGRVDVADLIDVLSAWGVCVGCVEDLNADGVVDLADVLLVLTAWGDC